MTLHYLRSKEMTESYERVTNTVLNGLSQYGDFYSRQLYLELEERISDLKDRIKESTQEGRVLRIGVVGQMKAGKSSFLNALIFEGEDILPKAITPMTAALTKIGYSNTPSAKICFYSYSEWENINKYAEEYKMEFSKKAKNQKFDLSEKSKKEILSNGISPKLKSCFELVEMYEKSAEDLSTFFGTSISIDINRENRNLYDYIGADGKYTPIVKHVELYFDNPNLDGIEIVDTPGINDPIASRGETTKKFLRACDVVFLLSSCAQFLDQTDISFICDLLPKEGVKQLAIVGSRLDSGLLDENKSKLFKEAKQRSIQTFNEQASNNIQAFLKYAYNEQLVRMLQNSLPPSYISSRLYMCYIKAKKSIPLDDQEKKTMSKLKERFPDFLEDEKFLLINSGIEQIKRNKILPILAEKQRIIEEKNASILRDNKNILINLLEDIQIQATQNKEDLVNYNKEQLEEKLNSVQKRMNSIRKEVRYLFDGAVVDAEKNIHAMLPRLHEEVEKHTDLNVQLEHETKRGSYKTGFFNLRTEHYTEEITHNIVSVADVLENIHEYITEVTRIVNSEFDKSVNVAQLKDRLKRTVIGVFDLSDSNFNENEIIGPVENATKKLSIPKVCVDIEKYQEDVLSVFPETFVKDNEIHKLTTMQGKILRKIAGDLSSSIEDNLHEINNLMKEQAGSFIDTIMLSIQGNIEMLKRQIDDRENALRQYETLTSQIVIYKNMIREMEITNGDN